MELFDRLWELQIKSNPASSESFDYVIKPNENGNSLKIEFEIDATIDIRFYSGEIRIYNLDPDKRQNLVFNRLEKDWGTGPSIKLIAGYKDKSGIIMDGVITRGVTRREISTGDFVTVLQCGTSFSNTQQVTIQSLKVTNQNALTFVTAWLAALLPEGSGVDSNGRFKIKRAKSFTPNLKNAIDLFTSKNTTDKTVAYSGPASTVLKQIEKDFKFVSYYDSEGFSVSTPTIENSPVELEISKETGMLGSPEYTDTGVNGLTYLMPELKIFQPVNVKSAVLDRVGKIITLTHSGDSHGNNWHSRFDASNIGQKIR